jgi:hypothetical protein
MAKKNRIKLPKTFAGYKLTKSTRRKLDWAVRLLDSPEVKALVASGVGAVVTHFAERREKSKKRLAKAAK